MSLLAHRARAAYSAILFAAVMLYSAVLPPAAAAQSMLRIVCDGDAQGAGIIIDGEFKGDCPLDTQVAPGTIRVEALKSLSAGRQRVFETRFQIGSGVAKRVEIELGPVQLTAEGKRLEEDRVRREQAAAEARAQEQRNSAQAAIDIRVVELLSAERERAGASTPGCPDCPLALPGQAMQQVRTEAPDTGDERTSALARQAIAMLTPLLTYPETFLPPGEVATLTCENAERQMRELAGMLDLSDLPVREQESNKAIDPDLYYYYRDVRIWPVQVGCQDGRLDGVLDFWIFGTYIHDTIGYLFVNPTLIHVTTRVEAGKTTGLTVRVKNERRGITFYKNALERQVMASSKFDRPRNNLTVELRQETGTDMLAANASYVFFADPGSQKASEGIRLSIFRPLGGGRSERMDWVGERLSARMPMKNGKYHGESVFYGYSISTGGFLSPDLKIPTSTLCYRENERVEMNPCLVD